MVVQLVNIICDGITCTACTVVLEFYFSCRVSEFTSIIAVLHDVFAWHSTMYTQLGLGAGGIFGARKM